MSGRATTAVYDHSTHDATRLLVMLAIANAANDACVAWPGMDEIARNARVSERQAQNVLRDLEASGELYRSLGGGRRNTTRYLITCGMDAERIAGALVQWLDVKADQAGEIAAQWVSRMTQAKAKADVQPTEKPVEAPVGVPVEKPPKEAPAKAPSVKAPPVKAPDAPKSPTPERRRDPLFDAVADVAVMNPALCGSRIAKATNALRKVDATPSQVSEFRTWWLSDTWRASNTPVPTPEQILSNWEKARQGVTPKQSAPAQKQSVAERVIGRRMGALGYERAQ
jgi:hypothetical protein